MAQCAPRNWITKSSRTRPHRGLIRVRASGPCVDGWHGLLRKYLVENFGLIAARTVLTQFGFAHGWRMAEAMRTEFQWDNEHEWRRAGTRISMLEGLFRVEAGSSDPLSKSGAMLAASYEAEQHLLHFGQADAPMCWTISAYQRYIAPTGTEIYVLEDRLSRQGDEACSCSDAP